MTWVVGATTPFGYGVVVSDICVTLADGTERDALRKSYPVGRFIVAGFAGSVRIGFDMIDGLRNFLAMSVADVKEGYCWDPGFVAKEFSSHARAIFNGHDSVEKASGCDLILVGVQPAEQVLGGGLSAVAVLRDPEFNPELATRWGHVMSIGSGTQEHKAMDALTATVSNIELLKTELSNPGGFGRYIGFTMTHHLFFGAPPGVSRHMHVSIVGVNYLTINANDVSYHPPDGEPIALRMPNVAESYGELCDMLGLCTNTAGGMRAQNLNWFPFSNTACQ